MNTNKANKFFEWIFWNKEFLKSLNIRLSVKVKKIKWIGDNPIKKNWLIPAYESLYKIKDAK